jgi:hypothetical protein
LTGILKKASEAEAKRKHKFFHFADRFLFRDAAVALKGLDLSKNDETAAMSDSFHSDRSTTPLRFVSLA